MFKFLEKRKLKKLKKELKKCKVREEVVVDDEDNETSEIIVEVPPNTVMLYSQLGRSFLSEEAQKDYDKIFEDAFPELYHDGIFNIPVTDENSVSNNMDLLEKFNDLSDEFMKTLDKSKIFVTSDLHLCHDKDFLYKKRGFNSIEEHDEAIVNNWNKVVSDEDTVYVLGDLMLLDDIKALKYIKRLNGYIHIITGNHDTPKRIKQYKDLKLNLPINSKLHISDITYADMIKVGKMQIYMSHYPTRLGSYEKRPNLIGLHGHTHSTDKFQYIDDCNYNVSLDAHNMTPVLIDDILADVKAYRKEHEGKEN